MIEKKGILTKQSVLQTVTKDFHGSFESDVEKSLLCFVFVEESSRAEGISEFEATNLRKELPLKNSKDEHQIPKSP
jgi:hypothetical protein